MSSNETTLSDQTQTEIALNETRIKELEAEMIELKLENEKKLIGTYQDRYEELVALEPWSIAKQFQEALEVSATYIREMTIAQIDELLEYFDGNSPSQKKKKLIQFLKVLGIYRTKDFKKMRNMFFSLRHRGKEALRKDKDETGYYEYCQQLGFKFE